jgi:uncharacterized protein (DUF1499 family)
MIQSYLVWSTVVFTLSQSLAFSPSSLQRSNSVPRLATRDGHEDLISRKEWVSQVVATMSASFIGATTAANAAEASEAASKAGPESSDSIKKCDTASKSPCVSTANVRQLDLYLPPWTFDKSADEVMSRLKGAIVADLACRIVKQEGNLYLRVEAKRNDLFSSVDELEFVINERDQVVTFRSTAVNEGTDFGANRKRLEEIRKRAGIFGVMGDSMNTADSVSTGERGNGPLGQLKAFYGLQSGGGFEDVLLDDQ